MSAFRLVLDRTLDESSRRDVALAAPRAEVVEAAGPAELAAALPGARALAGKLPEALIPLAGDVAWVHSWAAGPDTQLYGAFVDHPAVLTCSKGNGAIPLAEHAMMLMLLLNRGALRWLEAPRERRWDRFTHDELAGRTLGLIGTGHSGLDLAAKARAFHMRVRGLRRSPEPAAGVDEMFGRDRLHEFLSGCDVVVVTAPLTPDTAGLLGEAEFRGMRPTAHYVCFSRGGIADDAALLRALHEGWIAGAGLDAHSEEPLPPDSPFWTAPNTIVTPHNGATTPGTAARGWQIFLANLRRYAAGEPLDNRVDKIAGY